MLQLELPPSAALAWACALEDFDPGDDRHDAPLDAAAEIAASQLSVHATCALAELRDDEAEHGAVLLRNVPVDQPLPPTPTVEPPLGRPKPTAVSEGVILGVARLLGEPVAYAAEKEGVLVQNVYPVASERDMPSNASSAVDLDLHTELVFSRAEPDRPMHLASPDLLLLLCLRPDPARVAVTTVAEAQTLCASLGQTEWDELSSAEFDLRAPRSFTRDGDGSRPWVGPASLIHGPAGAPCIAFDLACGVRARSDAAGRALEALRHAALDARIELRLEQGDLLVVDNRRCAHGRTSFPADFDGRDRWVQRCYVRRSLDGIEPEPHARSRRVL